MPGHIGIANNFKADELAGKAPPSHAVSRMCSTLLVCSTTGKLIILAEERNELFAFSKVCLYLVVAVLTGHCPNNVHAVKLRIFSDVSCRSSIEEDEATWSKRSRELFALSKFSLCLVVGVLTEHGPNNVHAVRLRILLDASCRSCMKEDEVKTSQHFLLAKSRIKHLRAQTFRYTAELVGI